jgi:hypothetical protein
MYATGAMQVLKEWNRCGITPENFIHIAKEYERRTKKKKLYSFKLLYYWWTGLSKNSKAADTFNLRQPGKLFNCYPCATAHAFICYRAISRGSLHVIYCSTF